MMRSRILILLTMLLMLMGASNVFAQTAVLLPSGDIPKGAYVNGPGGATDDNYYFIVIKITYIATAGAGTATITLPDDITIADVDAANPTGTNAYDDEINLAWDGGVAGSFSLDIAGLTNSSTIVVNELIAMAGTEVLYVMFPIECSETATGTDNISIVFTAALTDISDLEVTYTDPSAMSPLTLTNFLDNVDPLETTYYGLFYPATAAAMTAALPDLATEGATEVFGSLVNVPQGVLLGYSTYNDGTDTDDMTYTLWFSEEADLGHISEGVSGAVKARTYDPPGTHDVDYTQNEVGTCATRVITSTLPEGDIYVYITSDLTGDFVLGRSDPITVNHDPLVKRVVCDYDGAGGYEPGIGAGLDDYALTLDTGGFLSFDGTLDATKPPRGFVELYFQVDDYDDNASVAVFRGTVDDLVDADIDFTGTTINGLGSGATAAVKLAEGFEENADDMGGYINWRWTLPTDASYVPTDEYFIYVVATDGSNAHLSVSRGFANWTDNLGVTTPLEATLSVTVANSPFLGFDTLQEYDSDGTPDHEMTIDTADYDVLMINWGKALGIEGDADIDDDATIELYIVFNTTDDAPNVAYYTTADNTGADALRLAQSLNDGTDGAHLIWSGGIEGDDEQSDNWYAWNLREDLVSTGWYPTLSAAGGPGDDHYQLYAIIDEDGLVPTAGIARVVALNTNDAGGADGDEIVGAGDTLDRISFANSGYARPTNPPQKGATIEATQTFRFDYDAYDLDEVGRIGIFLLRSDVAAAPHDITELEIGPMTTTPTKLDAAATLVPGAAYLVNSTTGDDGAAPPYVPVIETEGSELYYDWTPIAPAGTSPYTTDVNAAASPMADGEYYVYVGIDDAAGNFGGTETLYRAPGTLTITGLASTGPQRTFTLSPAKITPTLGDDTTIKIMAVDNGATIDMADFYVGIPKAYFNVANQSAPCTIGATLGAAGITLIYNETIDDDANGRWIVHCTLWDGSAYFGDLADNGTGTEVASFQVSCLGTTDAVEVSTSINYLSEAASGYLTRFEKDGIEIPAAGIANMSTKIQPRTIMEGVVQFQGRDIDSGALVIFELRERGTYEPVSDTSFDLNDDDGATAGLQVQLDTQGKFQLSDVPNGNWDMVVLYDRYLSSKQEISTGPGVDNLLVDFGELLGGDAGGYDDVSGNDIPNNAVNQEDVDKIVSALGNTSASAGWLAPDNDIYCDINESGTVTIADLSMASSNYTALGDPAKGAEPVFLKPAVSPDFQSNLDATVEFMNVPAEFKAGETYTIQVIVKGAADVKGYFINLEYDKEALSLGNIIKGDFFTSKTVSRSIVKDSMAGLANAVYGPVSFAGDGVLAEVSFTANMDAVFSPAVLGIKEATFVNSRFMEDGLDLLDLTYVENISPASFELNQNFPNPFNPTTTISFNVPTQNVVSIKVYDILGRHMRTLVDGSYSAGNHSVVWNATDMNGNDVSAGVYFYTIESGNFRETRRMLFMK